MVGFNENLIFFCALISCIHSINQALLIEKLSLQVSQLMKTIDILDLNATTYCGSIVHFYKKAI